MGTHFDLERIERAFVEAAVDPAKWNAAMEVAATATGSFGALLFDTESRLQGIPRSESMGASFETYMKRDWVQRDVRYGLLSKIARDGVATDFDLFTADQMSRHPYYQEFLAPHGLQWGACVKVGSGNCLWSLSLQRSTQQGPFSPAQLQTLANLSRRLGTASAISRMLGFARVEAALDAFETSRIAAIVFDASGYVVKINASAESMLKDGAFSVIGRRLYSDDRNATNTFYKSLKQILLLAPAAGVTPPVALPRPGRYPVLAHVLGLKSVAFNPLAPGQAVAVLIDPEARRSPAQAAIQACFSLTAAEAKLAHNLAAGSSLEEVAKASRISYETARNQLKVIFSKTDTHRQSELVALLTRLCPSPLERSAT